MVESLEPGTWGEQVTMQSSTGVARFFVKPQHRTNSTNQIFWSDQWKTCFHIALCLDRLSITALDPSIVINVTQDLHGAGESDSLLLGNWMSLVVFDGLTLYVHFLILHRPSTCVTLDHLDHVTTYIR